MSKEQSPRCTGVRSCTSGLFLAKCFAEVAIPTVWKKYNRG